MEGTENEGAEQTEAQASEGEGTEQAEGASAVEETNDEPGGDETTGETDDDAEVEHAEPDPTGRTGPVPPAEGVPADPED